MKLDYGNDFIYGRDLAKKLTIWAVLLGVASLFMGSINALVQLVMAFATLGLFICALCIVWKYCKCPHCGKHIVIGVLAVTTCPNCKRNLTTGKKNKK